MSFASGAIQGVRIGVEQGVPLRGAQIRRPIELRNAECMRGHCANIPEAGDEPAPADSGNRAYSSPIASSAEATTASAMPTILNGPGIWPASAIAIKAVSSGEAALVSAETTIALPSRSA